jgi:hypothetical protein
MGSSGRAFVEQRYSWDASFARVEEVLRRSVRPHGAGTPA